MVEDNNEIEETAAVDEDSSDAQINDTDIVFDCPHCGHNLCIDYRGAGLQITCSECGEAVLVPIPDGRKIEAKLAAVKKAVADLMDSLGANA